MNIDLNKNEKMELLWIEEAKVRLVKELIKSRKERKMSQEELSQISGVSRVTISRIENFSFQPELSTLIKLSFAFNKTISLVSLNDRDKMRSEGNKLDI